MQKTFAGVLTGDIVNSSSMTGQDYEQLLYTLQRTLQLVQTLSHGKFDIYRGDSFQAVFSDPAAAFKAALVIRLALRSSTPAFDARQCIGIGQVSLLRADVRSSMGEAFVLSGTGLDRMKSNFLAIHSSDAAQQERLELVTRLMDAHLSHLAPAQSDVLLHYLLAEDKSHQAVAIAAGKNRSNVTRLLNASRYHLVEDYLSYCQRYATAGQTA
jgi:hypothetical protein